MRTQVNLLTAPARTAAGPSDAGGELTVRTHGSSLAPSAREQEDAALVARSQNGDADAFGELVNRYQRTVYGIVSRMVDDRDDVDDIAQEVFVLAYRSMKSFKGQAAFSTWLYRIAVNTTINQMKKIRRRKSASIDDEDNGISESLAAAETDRPDEVVEREEKSRAVRKAVRRLPEKHRAVVVMHYFQNWSCDRIAEIMGCSVGTVWSRLHYACKKLRLEIDWLDVEGER